LADDGSRADSLIGRDAELATIHAFLVGADQVRAGLVGAGRRGGALVLVGDAGVGKTALLEAAVADAADSGVRTLRASGVEFESEISFAGLHQLLLPVLDRVAELPDGQREALTAALGLGTGGPAGQLMIVNAVLTLLSRQAADGPVALVIDDSAWLDRPSARTLSVLARRLAGTSVTLLAAARTDEDGFFDRMGLPALDIRPLDQGAAARLLNVRYPALAPPVRHRLLDDAEGNPLALLELPLGLTEPQRAGTATLPSVLPLTWRLQSVFEGRIASLPATTQRVLLLAVLDGFAPGAAVWSIGGRDVMADLAPAERVGLIGVEHGTGRVTFRHPLVRAAVAATSTGVQRRDAHRALAASYDGATERRAWHLAHAASAPDEETAALLEQAAHLIGARGDAAGAITALLRAADLSPYGEERSRRLAAAAYLGAVATGELRQVPVLLAGAGPRGSLPIAVAATFHLLVSGDGTIDAVHRMLSAALEAHPEPDDRIFPEALYTLAWVCYFGGRAELWRSFNDAVARLRPSVPPMIALVADTFGDPARISPESLARLDAAVAALPEQTDAILVARTGLACRLVDRLPACRPSLSRLREQARADGNVTLTLHSLSMLGLDRFMAGEWPEVRELADEHLQLSEAHEYRLLRNLSLWMYAVVAAGTGDRALVAELTGQMSRWAAPRGVGLVERLALHARTLDASTAGDYETAYRLASAISPAGTLASYVPHAMWVILDLVEAAVRTGREPAATAHVAAIRAAGVERISPRLRLVVEAAEAMVSDDLAGFRRALAVPGAGYWQFELARVRLAYGERLRRRKLTAEARTQLATALDTFLRIGAQPWADRARNEIRATGVAGSKTPDSVRVTLTPQQMQIAVLAAQGLTNKQIGERLFLSPRTVATHLYQLFPKLGITSRAALGDALARTPSHLTESGDPTSP
jgi:DNA-binding CsgD family transcriptional regulator